MPQKALQSGRLETGAPFVVETSNLSGWLRSIMNPFRLALSLAAIVASASQAMDAAPTHAIGSTFPASDWSTVGGDADNSRFSSLSQISTANVRHLGGAWSRELSTPTRAAPVIVGGTMYITDATTAYALSLTDGKSIWEYKPGGGALARGGVAVGGGMVFLGLSNANVIALDQKTGKKLWSGFIGNKGGQSCTKEPVEWGGSIPPFDPTIGFISGAPLYADGLVIAGLTGADGGVRGKVAALDAKTGRLVWAFYTIPAPGEPGSETWPQNTDALTLGGGAVWTTGAVDADLGVVYFGTGNAVPNLGGEIRPGNNLFTSTVIALDLKTGKLKWYYQLVHHDLWDMDVATPLILYQARVNGASVKALAAMRTDGYLFELDRETGNPIFPVQERPVKQDIRLRTSPTQPFPVNADEFGPACADPQTVPAGFQLGCYYDPIYSDRPGVISPFMTARQAPMSFDPQTGYFYVMGMVTPFAYRRVANPYSTANAHPPGAKEYGIYAAIDSRTNRIVWQHRSPWGLAGGSGAMTTAGGLLFHMEGDGNFQARDARTGSLLWQFQTGSTGVAGPNGLAGGVPAATYTFKGTQYVAAPMGKEVWVFKLGGTKRERSPAPPPPREYSFYGAVQRLPDDGSGQISTAPLLKQGEHYEDEYSLAPLRAQVREGVRFKWTNLGLMPHTMVASDGSWTSGEIRPGQSVSMSIEKPGTYVYSFQDQPWSKGELSVVAADEKAGEPGGEGTGAFTLAQATRGRQSFQTNCTAGCHRPDLSAGDRAPALAGDSFMQQWRGDTVEELFQRIRNTMPQQRPHSLDDQVYIDIVAFLLQANGNPAGNADLSTDPTKLKGYVLR